MIPTDVKFELDRSLLNETALLAHDLDTYAKVYPIGLGRPGSDVTE